MKIDDTSIEIIKQLKEGRKSFKKIAKELSVSENTVRARVTALIEKGVLEITGVFDPQALPNHKSAIIGVNLETMDLVRKGEEISNLRGVASVSVVTGRYDLIITILLKEGFGLLQFYNDELSKIEGIRSVETFVVYKGYNFKLPYIL